MNYVIESAFAYQGVHYGPGEKVPEKMSAAEKEEFFRGGKLAKVEGEKVIRFQRKIELSDVQIDMLLTQPLAIMEATLKSGSFSNESLGKILVRAIQMNLPQVAGLMYPNELVVMGEIPGTYDWAENLYQTLGIPGKYQNIQTLSDWLEE